LLDAGQPRAGAGARGLDGPGEVDALAEAELLDQRGGDVGVARGSLVAACGLAEEAESRSVQLGDAFGVGGGGHARVLAVVAGGGLGGAIRKSRRDTFVLF